MTTRADYEARQQERIAELRTATEDRPAHAAYLGALLAIPYADDLYEVSIPAGVSSRYAKALIDDVDWCRTRLPDDVRDGDDMVLANLAHHWPNAYAERRHLDRAASSRGATTRRNRMGLADPLSFRTARKDTNDG